LNSPARGVIGWSEEYVASKTGLREETLRASRKDYRETVAAFLSSLLNPPRLDGLPLLALCSLLPFEDRATWSMLETTKEAAARARRPTAEPHNSYGLSAEILTDLS